MPKKIPAWEVVLGVINPKNKRPRRTSLHTLAYVIGATDLLALAKEMKESGKVVGYVCPDVRTPIFYLKRMCGDPSVPGMIDSRNDSIWDKWSYPSVGCASLGEFVAKFPYPEIKGFKRFAYSGKYEMAKPYEPEDFEYAREIIKALKEAGYESGLKEEDLV